MPPAAGRTSLVVVVRRQGRMAGSIDSRLIVVDSWPVMVVHMLFGINWHQGIVSSFLSRLLWAVRRGRTAELLIARRHGSVTMLLFIMG